MRTENLQYIIAVAKSGSIHKAARECELSESALSQMIHATENELGYSIFLRSYNGMKLTEKGNDFIAYASEIVETYSKMQALQHCTDSARFSIGIQSSSLLLEPFYQICNRYSHLSNYQFTITTHMMRPLMEEVYLGNHQLGILVYTPAQEKIIEEHAANYKLLLRNIATVSCCINLRQGHPLLTEPFHLEKLWEYPFVDYIEKHYSSYPEIKTLGFVNPAKLILVNEREARYRVVSRTDAYSIGLPASKEVRETFGLSTLPFPYLQMKIDYLRRDRKLMPIAQEYIQLLKEELEKI